GDRPRILLVGLPPLVLRPAVQGDTQREQTRIGQQRPPIVGKEFHGRLERQDRQDERQPEQAEAPCRKTTLAAPDTPLRVEYPLPHAGGALLVRPPREVDALARRGETLDRLRAGKAVAQMSLSPRRVGTVGRTAVCDSGRLVPDDRRQDVHRQRLAVLGGGRIEQPDILLRRPHKRRVRRERRRARREHL